METGDKFRVIDESVLIAVAGIRNGAEGAVLYPTWIGNDPAVDDMDGYYAEFWINGNRECYGVLDSEVELIKSAA